MLFLNRIYERLFTPAGGKSYPDDNDFRRSCIYIISAVSLTLLIISSALNLYNGAVGILAPSLLVLLLQAACILLVRRRPEKAAQILSLLAGVLVCWGVFLLVTAEHFNLSRTLWLVLLPFVISCTGVCRGTAIFTVFAGVLCLLFFTPLASLMATEVPLGLKLRLLSVLCGSFFLSCSVEFLRFKYSRALAGTVGRLERDALTDPLTGLGNRRDFQNYYTLVSGKSARDGLPFAIIMIDIDLFKKVNDTYGHDVGDLVLQHITRVIGGSLRAMDRVFRWGGEEFIVLMPDTGAEEAMVAAERIRITVAETPCVLGKLKIEYTISLGVWSGDSKSVGGKMHEQIGLADKNLYQAKSGGGNAVVG